MCSDIEILSLWEKDPKKGFHLLVSTYREKLYYHIRRILITHEDSDDALQNTFLKIWQNLPGFRRGSSLYTWSYKIATNEALALLRKRKINKTVSSGIIENLFVNSPEADSWFDGDEAEKKFLNAILQLPEKQQLVFNMKYFEDLKYEEISEILSTSVGALKASYHLARKKIEELLNDD